MEIITPADYVGSLMELAQQRRGEFVDMQYLTEARTTLVYELPLAEVSVTRYLLPLLAVGPSGLSAVCSPKGLARHHWNAMFRLILQDGHKFCLVVLLRAVNFRLEVLMYRHRNRSLDQCSQTVFQSD